MQWPIRRVALSCLLIVSLLLACPLRGQAQQLDDILESANAAQSSGNYAEAAGLYARATALSPATPELWANRGVMEYLAGKMDASIASFKHSLQLNRGLFTPLLFLGKAYVQTGKPALALPYLNRARSLKPQDVEVLLTLGKANADLNQHRQAQSYYANASRLASDNASAWFGLGVSSLEIIAADGRELAASQAQTLWARALFADELLTQGRPLEAIDTYNAALSAATPGQRAILTRNLQWSAAHPDLFPISTDSKEAVRKLIGQLESGPNKAASPLCAPALTSLEAAACAYWAADYQRSAEQAGQALSKSPQDAEALYWSIKANERIAVAALSRFEELAPHSTASYVMVGDLFRHRRQNDAALVEYKKALALDPRDPPALIGAMAADLAIGNLDEASSMGQTALADRPLDPQLNLLMAEILAEKKQYGEAETYLAKCLGGPPEMQPKVHYLLGRADSEEGKTEEAIRQFEMALPGDEDGSIHYQLSRLYRKTGDLAHAQKAEAEAKALIKQRDANAAIAVREATGINP
jgi:tetratricopeptide (TPR) repeat protein